MTSNESHNESTSSITARASEWFVELREGDIDAAGRARFAAWLRKSPEHIRAYMEVAAVWGDIPRLAAGMDVDVESVVAYARAHSNVASLREADFGVRARGVGHSARSSEPPGSEPPTSESHDGVSHGEARDSDAYGGEARVGRVHVGQVRDGYSNRTSPQLSWIRRPLAVAAGIAAIAGCAGLLAWVLLGRAPVYSTAIGEQRAVVLADGSRIELSARSSVRVRLTDARRDVELLSGQALFRVAKDESRPFVVISDNTSVRAVGTQFDVHRRSSGTTVTVLEGRVAVRSQPGRRANVPAGTSGLAESTSLSNSPDRPRNAGRDVEPRGAGREHAGTASPDDRALYVSAGEQVTVPAVPVVADHAAMDVPNFQPRPIDPDIAVSWSERTLNFRDVPLSDVVEEFNRYNEVQIVITDPALTNLRISGVFSATKPVSLLRFLDGQMQLNVTTTEKQVRISPR